MISRIVKVPRHVKQILMIIFDFFAIIICLFGSFFIRLGEVYYPAEYERLLFIIFGAPLIAIPIFAHYGLYREVIRYFSFIAVWNTLKAVSTYAIIWGLVAFMIANWQVFPRSVVLINWLIVLLIIVGSRLLTRWFLLKTSSISVETRNVLIYGSGSAGRQLSSALRQSKEYKPIAFIDDDIKLHNHSINGLKVFSSSDLGILISKFNIKEVLLAMPSLNRIRRNELINLLEPFPIIVRSLPSILELAQGKVQVDHLLKIDVKDLLGRESVSPNKDLLKINITKKVVMITGAGGSIGSELCRQVLLLKPKKIILFEISESSLYLIEQELINTSQANLEIIPIIGSVLDKERILSTLNKYSVDTIYHAAAYKHVPLVEFNQEQGALNNSIGTMIVAQAAIVSKVETFVLISTDKAVRPSSIMGVTKRIAELILQSLSKEDNQTCFTMVRFGNVLDSSGSVIPLFKEQIKSGGPVTVTHADMVRYFMTIPEAVELVIQAGAMAKGGEVFVLNMGNPVKINDLAKKMIQLSGLQVLDKNNPKGDIEIKYTGLRPGEKLFEELLVDGNFAKTENQLIMRAEEEMLSWDELKPILNEIQIAANHSERGKLNKLFNQLVPRFDSLNS